MCECNLGYEIVWPGLREHKRVNYNCSFGGVPLSELGSLKKQKEVQHSVQALYECSKCEYKGAELYHL